jgi:hypothetical protein
MALHYQQHLAGRKIIQGEVKYKRQLTYFVKTAKTPENKNYSFAGKLKMADFGKQPQIMCSIYTG